MSPALFQQGARLLYRKVRHDQPVNCRSLCLLAEVLQAKAKYWVVVAHQHHRSFGNLRPETLHQVNTIPKGDPLLKGMETGSLDGGAVGQGVAEGNADLNAIGAGLNQGRYQLLGGLQVGETSGKIQDEPSLTLGLDVSELLLDAVCGHACARLR